MKKFVAIGHIVNDTEPTDHLGGGVSYAAVTAARLGYETHIITKCPPHHPYVSKLQSFGITVHVLPSKRSIITTFQNTYDAFGNRTQQVLSQQENITKADRDSFPKHVLQDAAILIATVLGEITPDLFPYFAKYGKVSLAPQGYFRKITPDNTVEHRYWNVSQKYLPAIDTIIFSEEDITMQGVKNDVLLRQFIDVIPTAIMTKGAQGSILYATDNLYSISSLPLNSEEIRDFTGAGDTFTAAFVISLLSTTDLRLAAANASFYAGLKVLGIGGSGIDAIPTKQQYKTFVANNKKRVNNFLQTNNIAGLSLFT